MKNLVLADCDAASVLNLVSSYFSKVMTSIPVSEYKKNPKFQKWQRIYDSIKDQIDVQGGIKYDGDI